MIHAVKVLISCSCNTLAFEVGLTPVLLYLRWCDCGLQWYYYFSPLDFIIIIFFLFIIIFSFQYILSVLMIQQQFY